MLLQWTAIPYGEKFLPFAKFCILQDGLTTHSTMHNTKQVMKHLVKTLLLRLLSVVYG